MKRFKKFLIKLFIIIAFTLVLYSRFVEPNLLQINIKTIHTQSLTNSDELTVIQFSDTHLSKHYPLNSLKSLVEKINSLSPDIVLFTGDLIDNYDAYGFEAEEIVSILSNINAPLGKYAVIGNHDYGGGAEMIYKKIMKQSGFDLLINETVSLNNYNLSVSGIDDAMFGTPDYYEIEKNLDTNSYNIMLVHEPDIVDNFSNFDIDLIVSGHSHGSQINLPFINSHILPPLARKYSRGMYKLDNTRGSVLYVNQGIGTSQLPFRFRAMPELTVFKITK